jgi:hypothetical protein
LACLKKSMRSWFDLLKRLRLRSGLKKGVIQMTSGFDASN